MITDEQVRWIALFFLFTFMDEKIALQSAHRAVAQLKAKAANANSDISAGESEGATMDGAISRVAIVQVLRKVWVQQKKAMPRYRQNHAAVSPRDDWALGENVDIAPWAKFQRDAPDDQLIAVTLSKILKLSDREIANGLNLSLGTVRYRIGKGIRQLGSVANTKR